MESKNKRAMYNGRVQWRNVDEIMWENCKKNRKGNATRYNLGIIEFMYGWKVMQLENSEMNGLGTAVRH